MQPKKDKVHLLVLRFSAMGDVLLLVPVIKALLERYQHMEITLVTRPKFKFFFQNISRLHLITADLDHTYKGFRGLFRLYKFLSKKKYNYGVDVHNNLRTTILKLFFKWSGLSFHTINKERGVKNKIAQSENQHVPQLKHTIERYMDVFRKAGFEASVAKHHTITLSNPQHKVNTFLEGLDPQKIWLGIAPFAFHKSKIWPIEKIKELVSKLDPDDYHLFLLGGGTKEIQMLQCIQKDNPSAILVAGEFDLNDELHIISRLHLLVGMDSANFHMAALLGVKTLSIWGGTHPNMGFGPFFKEDHDLIQIPESILPCRPCSVYGVETCKRKDFACLNDIQVEKVYQRIIKLTSKNRQ